MTYQWFKAESRTGVATAVTGLINPWEGSSYTPSTREAGVSYYYAEVTNTDYWPEGLSPTKGKTNTVQITVTKAADNPDFTPAAAVARLEKYLPRASYDVLFPNRYGSPYWKGLNPGKDAYDYYNYDELKQAVREMANFTYYLEVRDDNGVPSTWNYRATLYNKTTGISKVIFADPEFDASWNQSKPTHEFRADYGSIFGVGSENDRKREVAGFLASMVQETSGGTGIDPPNPSLPNQSGNRFQYALYYNEEIGYNDNSVGGYTQNPNAAWPPTPGKSYHGRGPKQLSWNYNYGHFSASIYDGDKFKLLNDPAALVRKQGGGLLGWKSAIWFFMTPQTPKPSSHDVMQSTWRPNAHQAKNGWVWGMGASIMVINGGIEFGFYEGQDFRVDTRIDAYRKIAQMLGANITGEKLDTGGMKPLS